MSVKAPLQLGVAKIDITPPKPVPLAGFASRTGKYEGIRQLLYARIFFFSQQHVGEYRRFVLITADLIWWETSFVQAIRQRLAEQMKLRPQDILLHGTHNHSGPQTGTDLTPSLGIADADYLEFLQQRISEGIHKAEKNSTKVTMTLHYDQCHMAVNRRKIVKGQVMMRPCLAGPVDPEVAVVCFQNSDLETVALLVNYACHATTTAENWVSSEFPGVAMEALEAKYGCLAGYLQGCCADIRPAMLKGEKFFRGDSQDVAILAGQLQQAVNRALHKKADCSEKGILTSRLISLQLPVQHLPGKTELKNALQEEGIRREWAEFLIVNPLRMQPSVNFEIIRLDLSPNLVLLGFSGEVAAEYGLTFKNIARRQGLQILPMGYSNGMTGYIPTAKQLQEGGYEAKDAAWYFALPAPFAAEIEPMLITAVHTIMKEDESNGKTTED